MSYIAPKKKAEVVRTIKETNKAFLVCCTVVKKTCTFSIQISFFLVTKTCCLPSLYYDDNFEMNNLPAYLSIHIHNIIYIYMQIMDWSFDFHLVGYSSFVSVYECCLNLSTRQRKEQI